MKNTFLKTILLLAMLISTQISSQQLRFFYQLSYKACDNCPELTKELDVLSVGKSKSTFQSYEQLQKDSAFIKASEDQKKYGTVVNIDHFMKNRVRHSYKVSKNYQTKEVFYKDILGDQISIEYEEKEKILWKLTPVKDSISGYPCQKATANFGGRLWHAWFTTKIPIQDGPYKFWELPGLIVQIEDEKREYSWKLVGNKMITTEDLYADNIMDYQGFQLTKTTKENFLKLQNQYRKNPLGDLLSHIDDLDGQAVKQLREQEKALLRYYEMNNYHIEMFESK